VRGAIRFLNKAESEIELIGKRDAAKRAADNDGDATTQKEEEKEKEVLNYNLDDLD
jgi:hypothetical protein